MKNLSLVLCLAVFPLIAACKKEFVPDHRITMPEVVKIDGLNGSMTFNFGTDADSWTMTSDQAWGAHHARQRRTGNHESQSLSRR